MHKISWVKIENFKSCNHIDIPLETYTALVGYNNAGKSNILDAVLWLLQKSVLKKEDFFDPLKELYIEAVVEGISEGILEGLTDPQRASIQPYILGESIRIRRMQRVPDARPNTINLDIWSSNEGAFGDWVSNPNGIDNAIKGIFPEPIVVGAMENATEDLSKFAKKSTIGQLLIEILDPLRNQQEGPLQEAFSVLQNLLAGSDEDKARELTSADGLFSSEVDKFFPGVSVKVQVDPPDLDLLLKNGTLKVFENDLAETKGRDVKSLGHGTQRSIQMALIKTLANKNRGGERFTTQLLLIDEPELYLHPQAIEYVRGALKSLSLNGYQVLFTTHSPMMISLDDAVNVALIKKDAADGTYVLKGLGEAIESAIADGNTQADMLFSLGRSSEVFFSENVLLAEGKTEKLILPELFKKGVGKTLVQKKQGLIELGGVESIPAAMDVLEAMKIPVKAIVDLDFAFRKAIDLGFILDTNTDYLKCMEEFQKMEAVGDLELNDGLPTSWNNNPSSKGFEMLAEIEEAKPSIKNLHDLLKTHNIWLWQKGTIEKHLGIEKTNNSRRSFLRRLKNEPFEEAVDDNVGVQALLNWLVS